MADRTTKVTLIANVSGYVAGMQLAAQRTAAVGSAAEQLAAKRAAFESLGRSMLLFGAVAVAATALAIKRFADFDQAMSNVAAVTSSSADEMDRLGAAALDAGGRTVFTATEAANALEELAKGGFNANESISALQGTLDLAASGQLEVARAAEIAVTTLKQFDLDPSQAGRVADVLSAGANKALGSVEDLAQALKFVGPVAASMGVSLEETAGALALFADQGIIGEQAGTTLRGVLSSLTSPSEIAKKKIEELGISLYDSSGAFLGLENVAGQLSEGLSGLTDQERDFALGVIFGNQQVTGARVLFSQGADAVAEYTAAVNDAGFAAKVAATRLDNLNGDLEKLSGAFDSAIIKAGSGANDILRSMVQNITFLVDAFGETPQPVLDAGLAIGSVAGAVALAGGVALLAIPKFASLKLALDDLGISGKTAALRSLAVGGAIGAATFAIGLFIDRQAELARVGDELAASLDKTTGAFTDYSREIVANDLQKGGFAETAEKIGISLDTLTDAAFGNKDALDAIDKAARENLILNGGSNQANIVNLQNNLNALRSEIEDAPDDMRDMQDATQDGADAYQEQADKVAELQSNLIALIETINKANGVGQDAVTANIDYQNALANVDEYIRQAREGVEGYSLTLDQSTQAGRDNMEMLVDIAADYQSAAEKQYALDGNTQSYIANLQAGRDAVLQRAEDLGATSDQVQYLSDNIVAMPTQKEIDILVDTANAQRQIDDFVLYNGRTISMSLKINGDSPGFAFGGFTGSGGKYQPAGIVHRGEFVSTQETTRNPYNRAALEYMHAGGDIRGYASGGWVGRAAETTVNVVVSPKGGVDLLKYVDVRIEQSDRVNTAESQVGWRQD